MKRIATVLTLFFSLNNSYSQSNIDVTHYKFEIELSDKNDSVKGNAFVTIKFIQPSDRFALSLSSPSRGKGMMENRVIENGKALTSMQSHDSILVVLNKPATLGEVRTFEIQYGGLPSDGLIISRNKYGDRTFFSDNWPNRAHNWLPCKDDPGDKATFEFIVTAPSQYRVISNGKLEEEKVLADNKKLTHWKEDVSLPTKVMVIGVAKFAVKQFEDSPAYIPVSAWVYPQDSVNGFRNYSVAPGIVKFFSNYIGPYPYNKLANVQSKTIFGGMENASAIFYFEKSAEENISTEDLMAHEIAHQWFGDMVTEKKFSHLWLSEGFATYMADVYLESKYGFDSMNNRLKEERSKVIEYVARSGKPVVDSISSLMTLLNPNSYEKGGWILHMLRRQMGDSMFQTFIRKYYDRYKGKNADTEDLEKVAEEVAGKSLQQFFTQWLYTPGIPQLKIEWHYDKSDKAVSIHVTQQQKTIFQLPLELKLEADKPVFKTLHISTRSETFSIPMNALVQRIYVDPNTSLLFEEVK
jgi:aminopeptidase N